VSFVENSGQSISLEMFEDETHKVYALLMEKYLLIRSEKWEFPHIPGESLPAALKAILLKKYLSFSWIKSVFYGPIILNLGSDKVILQKLEELMPSLHWVNLKPNSGETKPNSVEKWDSYHVKFPYSSSNTYEKDGQICSQWSRIKSALLVRERTASERLVKKVLGNNESEKRPKDVPKQFNSTRHFEAAVREYNPSVTDFAALHGYEEEFPAEAKKFLSEILPGIISLALELPKLCSEPIPLLVPSKDQKIVLSQVQIACLLANSFLCAWPTQGGPVDLPEWQPAQSNRTPEYPPCNFDGLYAMVKKLGKVIPYQFHKIQCVISYFEYFLKERNNREWGNLSFHRGVLSTFPSWETSTKTLHNLEAVAKGSIEDQENHLQVDFANKKIGGGVLGRGCVQEEIRFLINTELMATMIFTAIMESNEVVLIKGSERFSNYGGYGDNFFRNGSYTDKIPRDLDQCKKTYIVAMDAFDFFSDKTIQYSWDLILREMNKAYAGFSIDAGEQLFSPVASGNWGCGAFGGFRQLKALLQLLAATEAGRDLKYITFREEELAVAFDGLHFRLKSKGVTVGQIVQVLKEFPGLEEAQQIVLEENNGGPKGREPPLFSFLLAKFK